MGMSTVLILLAVALVGLLVIEFFYFKNLFGRFLKFWKIDRKPKLAKWLKVAMMVIIMPLSIMVFTKVGLWGFHFVAITALVDLFCFIVRKILRKDIKVLKAISASLIVSVVLTCSVMLYAYINMNTVVRTQYTVHTDKELERDYRVVFISDLHLGNSVKIDELQEICDRINAEKPDVFALVGDIVDESTTKEDMEKAFEMFSSVESEYGTYFVYGNHDDMKLRHSESRRNYDSTDMEKTMDEFSITCLQDDVVKINDDITVVGHKDASFFSDNADNLRLPIAKLTENVDKRNFILLLDHQPTQFEDNKNAGVDLQISGHTHAGQIWPMGCFISLFKTADLDYGYEEFDSFNAIVSSGISGWSFPYRTEENSEYVVIDITDK